MPHETRRFFVQFQDPYNDYGHWYDVPEQPRYYDNVMDAIRRCKALVDSDSDFWYRVVERHDDVMWNGAPE